MVTGPRTSHRLQSAPRRYELVLFRLKKEVTQQDITSFLNEEEMDVVETECLSKEEYYTDLQSSSVGQ